jgi:hypothetical protein
VGSPACWPGAGISAQWSPEAEGLDDQISSLIESVEVDAKGTNSAPSAQREVLARHRARSIVAPRPARKRARKPTARIKLPPVPPPNAVQPDRPLPTNPRAQARPRPYPANRPRADGLSLANPATRELAFFVFADLILGAVVGVLIALST